MLEKTYHTIDIQPQRYPFTHEGADHPSSQWESLNDASYKLFFTSGPPAKLPDIQKSEPGRRNNPHAKNAYHIIKINREKVCDVTSLLIGQQNAGVSYDSVSRATYMQKPLPERTPKKIMLPADQIVPVNSVQNIYDERMLPACSKVVTMTTAPPLQYTGRKKRARPPYSESGVFYGGCGDSTLDGANISSLCGQQFSRRKQLNGRKNCLTVKDFDGGAQGVDMPSFGLRTGYRYSSHYLQLR